MRPNWLIGGSILSPTKRPKHFPAEPGNGSKRKQQQTRFVLFCLTFTCLFLTVDFPKSVAQPTPVVGIERPILRTGSRGAVVSELQAALKLLGYYTGTVDGIYGESTAIAVTQFQRSAGLTADGIVGPATWQRLFPPTASTPPSPSPATPPEVSPTPTSTATQPETSNAGTTTGQLPAGNLPILRLGMRGPAVFWLQKRLQTTGYFRGSVDGIFGADTEAAVKAAQQNYRLNADGIVGPATWRALLP
jgi:N-acetylmuramoyl-L-alanine amidase